MSVTVRKASEADSSVIVDLLGTGQEEDGYGEWMVFDHGVASAFVDDLISKHRVFVAEIDNRIVGAIGLTFNTTYCSPKPNQAAVAFIRVASGARRNGAGRALMTEAMSVAKDAGIPLMLASANVKGGMAPTEALLASFGFEPVERIYFAEVK